MGDGVDGENGYINNEVSVIKRPRPGQIVCQLVSFYLDASMSRIQEATGRPNI